MSKKMRHRILILMAMILMMTTNCIIYAFHPPCLSLMTMNNENKLMTRSRVLAPLQQAQLPLPLQLQQHRHRQSHRHRHPHMLWVASSDTDTPTAPTTATTTSTATTTITQRQDLEQMTIKQLKSYIQEHDLQHLHHPLAQPPLQEDDNRNAQGGDDGKQSRKRGRGGISISSLKRKEEFVDFIWNHHQRSRRMSIDDTGDATTSSDDATDAEDGGGDQNNSNSNTADDVSLPSISTTTRTTDNDKNVPLPSSRVEERNRKKGTFTVNMPPLSSPLLDQVAAASPPSNTSYESSAISPSYSTTTTLTPRDRIILDVLHRYYPTLLDTTTSTFTAPDSTFSDRNDIKQQRQQQQQQQQQQRQLQTQELLSSIDSITTPTGMGENDIRQIYHPMLVNASQSDMDIVFIGTASCTPGITRGVSCTALRLNWRRRLNSAVDDRGGGGEDDRGETNAASNTSGGNGNGSSGGGTWLFDCGESTQLSVQKTTSIKPGKITKIFLTHCHGDHSFGLPGLLCLMGTDRDNDSPPVEIYGPEGLRMWLRVAIRYSVSRVVPPYRVHELMDVPMAPEWMEGHRKNGRFYYQWKRDDGNNGDIEEDEDSDDDDDVRSTSRGKAVGGIKGRRTRKRWRMQGLAGADPVSWISRAPMMNLEASTDFGEIEGGRDIFPQYNHPQSSNGAPIWEVENDDDDDVTVHAAPMSHGVPCVGYIVHERDRPGRLRPENVLPIIKRNHHGLIEAGVRNPMKIMATIKNLPMGGSYTFPDGTVVRQEDVVEPPRRGRKVVICGDTTDCSAMEGLAQDADVVVHEATNTFLPGVDKDGNMRLVTKDAKIHGHSTPAMAGEFAKRINAKKLVLNHFSARYKGDQSIDSMTIMTRIERQAIKASELPEDSVAAAWDFMILPLARE